MGLCIVQIVRFLELAALLDAVDAHFRRVDLALRLYLRAALGLKWAQAAHRQLLVHVAEIMGRGRVDSSGVARSQQVVVGLIHRGSRL